MNSPTASSSTTADSPRPSDISAGKRPASSSRPQNLRFQRRTSERAYLEGAYRDGSVTSPEISAQRQSYIGRGMDYSAAAAGSSPWANSPEASRQSFGDQVEAGDSLPPPVIQQQQQRESGEEGGWSAEQQQQWQQQGQQQQYPQQGQQQQQYQGNGEENRRPHSAARYHGAPPHHQPPQQQRQPAPQYKLQAKITGLERTGKKDAILRFDVYVCQRSGTDRG